jgi:hypothetical protein
MIRALSRPQETTDATGTNGRSQHPRYRVEKKQSINFQSQIVIKDKTNISIVFVVTGEFQF